MLSLDLSAFGTTTLGSLIDILKRCPPEADVQYDFCYLAPTTVDSYRGYYDHLALGWTDKYEGEGHWPKVKDLLPILERAVGHAYQGYKGGEYVMDSGTPLWVANYSHSGGTGIIGVEIEGKHSVVLVTSKVD